MLSNRTGMQGQQAWWWRNPYIHRQRWCSSPKQPFIYAKDSIIETTAITCGTKLSCKFSSFNIYMLYLHPLPSSRISRITTFFYTFTAFTPQLSESFALVSRDFNTFSTRSLTLLGLGNIAQFPSRDQAYSDHVYVNHPSLFAIRRRALFYYH